MRSAMYCASPDREARLPASDDDDVTAKQR
jgi:hypothetical protein